MENPENNAATEFTINEFDVNRTAVKKYFLAVMVSLSAIPLVFCTPAIAALMNPNSDTVGVLIVLFCFLGIVTGLFIVLCLFGLWLCPRKASSLRYWLDESTLRVNDGVFFQFHRSIPLERITDVILVQGPLMRFFDIVAIQIHAGSGHHEAKLYGVHDPEKVRKLILSQRRCACGGKAEDKNNNAISIDRDFD